MCSAPLPISPSPVRYWGTCQRRRFGRVFDASSNGIGRLMAGQTELLLARARERFVVQDYYGTVHLLESVVDSGRAFADVHHLLGVSLSLLGQSQRALDQLDRALELNPHYVEALIHRGLVLNELGRTEEAEQAFSKAAGSLTESTAGLPAPVAAQLANRHAELADSYAGVGALDRAIQQYQQALEL